MTDAIDHYNLAVDLQGQGKLEEAVAEYRTAIRIRPDLAEAHISLANALDEQGKDEEAIAEYRAAIRIKPDFAQAHYSLGIALGQQGKRDEAIAELRKARDNALRGSELAQLIEKALKELDH
jgi:tetratricopeptide (TPR) repeat protein